MVQERSLFKDLMRFYGRLLTFSSGVVAVVMLLASLWLYYRGTPITLKALSSPVFVGGMVCLFVTYLSLSSGTERRWQAQALWARTPISNDVILADQEQQIGLAWYTGTSGLLCILVSALPYLLK